MSDETTDTAPQDTADSEHSASESGFTDDPSSASVDNEPDVEEEEEEENAHDSEDSKSVHGEVAEDEPAKPAKPAKPVVAKEVKQPGMAKGPLEYDLADMYPEVGVLVGKPRREWNYQDPEVIRALWLDTKTNVITEWKIRNANLSKARQTEVEIPLNHTAQLRLELHKQKEEKRKAEFKELDVMLANSKVPPQFNTVQMATTTTVEMRYKFTRNNPPVPSYYINHYDKYKKPPFKTKIDRPCKQDESMSR